MQQAVTRHLPVAALGVESKSMQYLALGGFVAAALELFASIALMFWYVLQLFMSRD